MSARSQRSLQERHARSRLVKRIAELPLLNGILQRRARSCGKPTCHCRHGQKHVSLYLVARVDGRQKQFYIPWEMEPTVRHHKEVIVVAKGEQRLLLQEHPLLTMSPEELAASSSDDLIAAVRKAVQK